MIVIRHKQTGKEHTYNAKVFYKHDIDLSAYEIISWEDVVELFDKFGGSHGIMEKVEAEKIINDSGAMMGYRWIEVPPVGMAVPMEETIKKAVNELNYSLVPKQDLPRLDKENLLPTNTVKVYVPTKTKIKTTIYKYKDNLWVITIVGGLIVLVLGTWILVKLGIIH